MKSFTVRQLDREPNTVLDACDQNGAVEIRRRNGRIYVIRPSVEKSSGRAWPDFAQRRAALFRKPLTKAFARKLDKLIAGE